MAEQDAVFQIRMQVMWNRLISVVEEQAQTLMRTAFCTATREGGDLSAGVFDPKGRMVAQAVTGTAGHVNSMANGLKHFLKKYPVETMEDGDHYLTNDPWIASGHLHDFLIVTPCFHQGRLVALLSAIIHVVDIGGRGYIATCRQVYEEGLFVPIVPFIKAGKTSDLLLELIKENVREPTQVIGDLYALVSCTNDGCKRLRTMMEELDIDDLDELADYIIDSSREATLREIRKIPRGTYRYTLMSDGMDFEVKVVGALTVSDDGIHVDYTGTSPMSDFGINVVKNYTDAYTLFGVNCVLGPDIPQNAGSLEPVKVTAPEGSILNALRPWPVAARHVIGHMLPDVVMGCLVQAIPDQVMGESGMTWNPQIRGGPSVVGREGDDVDVDDLPVFDVFMINSGGMGARFNKDGLSATAFPSGVRTTPAEASETIAPIVVWRKEFRRDSGGPGMFRGGLGQIVEVGGADNFPFSASVMLDKVINCPLGRNGGKPGAGGRVLLKSGKELAQKGVHRIPRGDRLYMELPGAGGYGDPLERDPVAAVADVLDDLVSPETLRRDYGVVMDDEGALDREATDRLRDELRARRSS